MTAPTTALRQSVVTMLGSALTPIPVYDSRSIPLAPSGLPAVIVYTPSKSGEATATGSRLRETVTLRIECHVGTPANATEATADALVEAARDALVYAVESVLLGSQTFRRQFSRLSRRSDNAGRDPESEQRQAIGVVEIHGTWEQIYDYPTTDDLELLHVVLDCIQPTSDGLDGPDGFVEAELELDLT